MDLRALNIVGVVAVVAIGTSAPRATAVSIAVHPLPAGSAPPSTVFAAPGGVVVGGTTRGRVFDSVLGGPGAVVTPGPAGNEAERFCSGSTGALWYLTDTVEFWPAGATNVPFPVIGEGTAATAAPRFKYSTPWDRPATPLDCAIGADGAIWLADTMGHAIERYVSGQLHTYQLSSSDAAPVRIVPGPDGAVWFTNPGNATIGRITTAGEISEYSIPGPWDKTADYGITVGPEGVFWITEQNGAVGRLTVTGEVTQFVIPNPPPNAPRSYLSEPSPREIITGREGVMWFTDPGKYAIGRITPAGEISEYEVPSFGTPISLAQAPNGEILFTESDASVLGSLNPAGSEVKAGDPPATTRHQKCRRAPRRGTRGHARRNSCGLSKRAVRRG